MIPVKTPAELDRMRASNRIAADVLRAIMAQVRPGVTTRELEELAVEEITRRGARSAFLGYRGYPAHICVSINEQVVHGIPGPRVIRMGDVVSIDVGVVYEGFVGDTAATVAVGVTDPDVLRLIAATEQALANAIAVARAGAHLSDLSHAIESTATAAGFNVVRDFVGHGIGRRMHEEPQVPNFGPPGRGPLLRPGMTLAIEPMLTMGDWRVRVLPDGWTVVTVDGRPSAHAEHTIAIGEDGAEVLTRPSQGMDGGRTD